MTIHPARVHPVDSKVARPFETAGPRSRVFERVVSHGGREFVATRDMATIFSARAEDVVARGDTELVPLLHQGGVALLLISPETTFSVTPLRSTTHLRAV